MTTPRRFPPPWSAEVTPNCFIVRDANGQALSYIYYESELGRRSAAKLLSVDSVRRGMAVLLGFFLGLFGAALGLLGLERRSTVLQKFTRVARSLTCIPLINEKFLAHQPGDDG